MKKRDLKVNILRFLMARDMHGYEIGRKLSSRGLSGQLSYIYQVLSEMRKEGLIKSIWQNRNNGRKRKVYSLAIGGREELQTTLKDIISSVHEFYSDYLARLPAKDWLIKWEGMLISNEMKEPSTFVFVVDKPSALRVYQFILEYYCNKVGRDVYLVKEKSIDFSVNLKNLVAMTGSHTEIPLRRDFADVVVAFDPPKPELLEEAVTEFHRVVKKDGVAAIGYPNIEEQEAPLTIGAFIERIHYDLNNQGFPDEQIIRLTFEKYFHTVKATRVSSFTLFTGKGK